MTRREAVPRRRTTSWLHRAAAALIAGALHAAGHAQTISTVAGGIVNAPAVSLVTGSSAGVATGPNGTVYYTAGNQLLQLSPATGLATLVAGSAQNTAGYSGDTGPATSALLNTPSGVAVDAAGDVFVADQDNDVIRRIDAVTQVITTVAGNGSNGYSGDGGGATSAQLNNPGGIAVDAAGNLYVADVGNSVVRRVDAYAQTITTVAGTGTSGYDGDGGPATNAELNAPWGIAVDAAGNLYVGDSGNSVVRFIAAASQTITTLAGTGGFGYAGDGGPAAGAELFEPFGVAVDGGGNLYVADYFNSAIRRVDAVSQNITTVAGTGVYGYSGDGGPATSAAISYPIGVGIDASGNLYLADGANFVVRAVAAASQLMTTAAGGGTPGASANGAAATAAELDAPQGLIIDAAGDVLLADTEDHVVRCVDAVSGAITTVAGTGTAGYGGDGGPATSAPLNAPTGLALDALGNLYIADTGNNAVRRVTLSGGCTSGTIATYAGSPSLAAGYGGDGGLATAALLNQPIGLAFDAAGNLYLADSGNNAIRIVNPQAVIGTYAGTPGSAGGYAGDGGPATAALLNGPQGVTADGQGDLYVADTGNEVIRLISTGGTISTVAGNYALGAGYGGDNGAATAAQLNAPTGVAFAAASGVLYIADTDNSLLRTVATSTGTIATAAGNPALGYGYSGDGASPTLAQLASPGAVALDAAGDVYIADTNNARIRLVPAAAPLITPSIRGTLGKNDWYTSTVSVAWRVTKTVGSTRTSGCGPSTVDTNTAGLVLTCTVSDRRGTTSRSVTIKRDAIPPVTIASAAPTPAAHGWNKAPVTVKFTGTDAVSGVAPNGCSAPVVLAGNGAGQSATGQCADRAGNVAAATIEGINIDQIPPVVRITTPANGASYALGSLVKASFACTDALSGVATCTGTVADGAPLDTATKGSHTFAVAATDRAGNLSTKSLSYTIAAPIRRFGLNPGALTFGSQRVGTTSAPAIVTLRNLGNAALALTKVALTGGNSSEFSRTTDCPATLAVDGECTIRVEFHPTASGAAKGELAVSATGATTQSLSLSGTGSSSVRGDSAF